MRKPNLRNVQNLYKVQVQPVGGRAGNRTLCRLRLKAAPVQPPLTASWSRVQCNQGHSLCDASHPPQPLTVLFCFKVEMTQLGGVFAVPAHPRAKNYTPLLQIKKLRLRMMKGLVWGHPSGEAWDSKPIQKALPQSPESLGGMGTLAQGEDHRLTRESSAPFEVPTLCFLSF